MHAIMTIFAIAVVSGVMAATTPAPALAVGAPVTLYDADQGTLPELQGWTYLPFGTVNRSVAGGLLSFDTSFENGTQAGFFRLVQSLDTTAGFRISLSAQVLSEVHANDNRAGFSLIVLDSAHRGVELGFWANSVFALNAPTLANPGLFTHAESSTSGFRPDATLQSYSLQMYNGTYSLSASGTTILSGALRDYSASVVPVYSTPNLVFFGDDTTSARANMNIGAVTVSAVPEPEVYAMMMVGLGLVGFAARRRKQKTA